MSSVALLGVAATTAGVILGVAPVAQMRLVVVRKSSEGISIAYWLILIVTMSLWLSYGIATRDPALIVANSVAVSVALVMVAVLVRYRPRPIDRPLPDTEPEPTA